MKHRIIDNAFFKDDGQRPAKPGTIRLPVEADGAVHGVRFVEVLFDPICNSVRFVDCIFEDCEGLTDETMKGVPSANPKKE
jgi:hypothetical protein